MQVETDKKIGKKLREYRIINKISQREIADLWGIKPNSIAGYESGAVSIKPEYITLFINKYKLPAEYFNVDTINDTFNEPNYNNSNINSIEAMQTEVNYKDKYIEALEEISRLKDQIMSINSLVGAESKKAI